jgi:DNA polymerase III epsilon subunit-like protein
VSYLFVDTETKSLEDKTLLQLAYCLTDADGNKLVERALNTNNAVPENHFSLSSEDNENRSLYGHYVEYVMDELDNVIWSELGLTIVIHNAKFDLTVLEINGNIEYELSDVFCTMTDKRIIDYLKIPVKEGSKAQELGFKYKYPSLSEMYEVLFSEPLQDAHAALQDMRATMKCFFELKRLGVI